MRYLLLAAGFLVGMTCQALAAGLYDQFPDASHPLTGDESWAADTNLSGGRSPQTNEITLDQAKNYAIAPVTPDYNGGSSEDGEVDIDLSTGNFFTVELTTPSTINTPSNAQNGQVWFFEAIQDSTGSRTLTWTASSFAWPEITGGSNTAPTVTSTAGNADIYQCHTLSSKHLCARVGYSYNP